MPPSYDSAWFQRPRTEVEVSWGTDLSSRVFAGLIGVLLLVGLGLIGVGAMLSVLLPSPWLATLLGGFVAWIGYSVTIRNERWLPSLGGFVLANSGIGLLLAPLSLLPEASGAWGLGGVVWTGLAIMVAAAWIHPTLVRMFGTFLVGSAGAYVLFRWGGGIGLPLGSTPSLLEMLAVLLALGYLDYYWTRALRLPRTLNNAVDSASAVYADLWGGILNYLERRAAGRAGRAS